MSIERLIVGYLTNHSGRTLPLFRKPTVAERIQWWFNGWTWRLK